MSSTMLTRNEGARKADLTGRGARTETEQNKSMSYCSKKCKGKLGEIQSIEEELSTTRINLISAHQQVDQTKGELLSLQTLKEVKESWLPRTSSCSRHWRRSTL